MENFEFGAEDTTAKRVISRMENLKSERSNTENILQEIADHCVGRGDFSTERENDELRDELIFDNTSINQSNLLSAALDSVMTNVSTRWFGLGIDTPGLEDDEEVTSWLQEAEDIMYAEMTAPEANLAPQLHEMYQDLVDFGTAAIQIDDVPGKGIRFSSRPLGEIYIAEDAYGRVNTVYRPFKYTALQAVERWGEEAGHRVVEASKSKNPDQKFEFVHAIEPNDGYIAGDSSPFNKKFVSYYVNVADKRVVEEGGFHEMPIPTPRWRKVPGQVYGSSPGRAALTPQKMLNEMERTTVVQAQKAVEPPLLVPNDGSVLSINQDPHGIIPYTPDVTGQRGAGVEYLESRSRFDVANDQMARRQQMVKESYHFEIQNIFQDPRMTATQVVELSARAQQLMGPMLQRIQIEALEPIIERVFGILIRAGRFPEAPAVLEGITLNIKYVSPASRAQQASDIEALDKFVLKAIEMSQVFPDALDLVDPDEVMRQMAESLGVRGGTLRSRRIVSQLREAKNQQSEEDSQTQDMLQATQGIKNLTPALALAQEAQAA